MASAIRTIHHAAVNCYLVTAGDGFVLIDTGKPEKRTDLDTDLEDAGCRLGMLRLIVLTHGDYDHAGNAAYLRAKYGTRVAMHRDDSGRVERADWNWNLKPKPDKFGLTFRVVSLFIKPGSFDMFEPDLYLEDEESLSDYGFDATVLHLPGHTKGSIGILTTERRPVLRRPDGQHGQAELGVLHRRHGRGRGEPRETEKPRSRHGLPRSRQAVPTRTGRG